MKEYKTFTFDDSASGRNEMGNIIDRMAKYGWELKSKEVSQQGWSFGKTCCLGWIFLPLALLGKKGNIITVILEREQSSNNVALDKKYKEEEEIINKSQYTSSGCMEVFLKIALFPITLSIAIWNQHWKTPVKIALIVILWLFIIIIGSQMQTSEKANNSQITTPTPTVSTQ